MNRATLASQINRIVITVYLAIALPILGWQLYDEYRRIQHHVERDLINAQEIFQAPMETAFWQFDQPQLESIINSIVSDLHIDGLAVVRHVADGEDELIHFSGAVPEEIQQLPVSSDFNFQIPDRPEVLQSNKLNHRFDLLGMRDRHQVMATVTVYGSQSKIKGEFIDVLVSVMLGNLLKITVLLMLFYFGVSRMLARTLSAVIAKAEEIDNTPAERVAQIDHLAVDVSDSQEVEQLKSSLNQLVDHSRLIRSYQDDLKREVSERTAELEKALHAKDDFLASMSHELRTPLTTMIGVNELLQEEIDDVDQQQLLQASISSSHNLLALVNDILDLSKIESGKFTLDYAPFDLVALLNDLQRMFGVTVQDKAISFEIKQQTSPTFQLWGDGKRIGQVLINLISNAIKFTEQGGVTLTCSAESGGLSFSVEDSGIGMDRRTLDRLFKPFEQADNSISRRYGGTGLGLHISWALAEQMEGSIEVVSEPGKGSTFTFKVPLQESDLPVSQHQREEKGDNFSVLQQQFSGQVLVVEDTPELQMLEQRILESLGLVVTIANHGKEAIEAVEQHPFDLILMDLQMPIMNGLEATATLRERGVQTPIIALTANVMQKHRDAFDRAGCDGFLGKPIDERELKQILERYLPLRQDREYLEAMGIEDRRKGARRTEEIAVIDDDRGKPRRLADQIGQALQRQSATTCVADEAIDDELMAVFRESAANYTHALKNALSKRAWEELRKTAHTVKGSAASFGFNEISRKAEVLLSVLDEQALDSVPELTMDLIIELGKIM